MRLTEAEWMVMQVIWRWHPTTAREVLDALAGRTTWAYSTVKTILTRLVEKGALSVRKRANTSRYEPLVSRDEARHVAVRALIDRAFDGSFAPLLRFLLEEEELPAPERKAVADLLAEHEARRGRT